MDQSFQLQVADEHTETRLDVLLAGQFPQFSRVRIRSAINAAEILVNGHRSKAAYRVRPGDLVSGRISAPQHDQPEPEDIPLSVLYEDDRLAVINKPHGMVVHPSKGHWSGTLTAALAHRYQHLSAVGGSNRPGIVHRLDRDTSGVIVIARDDQAHLALAQQFEQRTVEKEYFAICRGRLDRDRDRIEQPIGPHPYQREKMAIRSEHPASRAASTFYEVAERYRGFVAVRVFPKTGRTHQIRVHLAHVGCPVLCDPLYSGQHRLTRHELEGRAPDGEVVFDRLALHARRLVIDHPDDGRRMEFEAPLPAEFEALQRILPRLDANQRGSGGARRD